MARRKPKAEEIELDQFQDVPDDQGISLDELSESFARLLGEGQTPYDGEDEATVAGSEAPESLAGEIAPAEILAEMPDEALDEALDERFADDCPVSPENIIEAILFVGHPSDEPISSRNIASLMRGVRAAEVEGLITELNASYEQNNCPYTIESAARGFRMVLREEFQHVRERFYGRVREAQLSQDAINTLAIVAYNQPLDKKRILAISGEENTGRVLSQLVRRGLVSAKKLASEEAMSTDKSAGKKSQQAKTKQRKKPKSQMQYETTDRFLQLFGLGSLADLPQNHDLSES